MKKKTVLTVLACVCVLAAVLYVSLAPPGYASVLEANWGISLPREAQCKELYAKDTGPSFHGDGVRYHVFSYKHEDFMEWMLNWRPPSHTLGTRYYGSAEQAARAWLDEIGVPEGRRPDYSACDWRYLQKTYHNEALFFLDREQNLLYVIENLI